LAGHIRTSVHIALTLSFADALNSIS
jgi:hypothetical protein